MKSPIRVSWRTEIVPVILLAASLVASFYFYAHFPDQVVIHWDIAGQPNGYGSRALAAYFFPCLLIAIYALFLALPFLDPKKDRYQEFAPTYHNFKNILILALTVLYFLASLANLGWVVPLDYYVPFIIGVLFFIIGSQLTNIKPNWFLGIRTPWTLSSETVWTKTHRLGGRLFMICGLLMALTGLLPVSWRAFIFIAIMAILLIGTISYSYVIYVQEKH